MKKLRILFLMLLTVALTMTSCAGLNLGGNGNGNGDGNGEGDNAPKPSLGVNTPEDPTFCGGDTGVFAELVMTGQKIFYRLRDLIYVVAGFGIIAVSVGAFFGTLNWKWLGAIVISLLVIASAGELLVLLTGCEQYGTDLIRDTLSNPTQNLAS